MASFAAAGSQRWLQIAVNRKPDLLLAALRRSGAVGPRISVEWRSPLEAEQFQEYRDGKALAKAGIVDPKVPLASFWPARGPVWDAIGVTSDGRPVFVEAKAHIPEAASPATRATPTSLIVRIKGLTPDITPVYQTLPDITAPQTLAKKLAPC